MSELDLLEKITAEHDKNKKLEGKIRAFLFSIIGIFAVFTVVTYGNVMVIQENTEHNTETIQSLQRNSVTYDNFMMFNRTYELQLEEMLVLGTKDMHRVRELQEKYRELRSMVVQQRVTRSLKPNETKE